MGKYSIKFVASVRGLTVPYTRYHKPNMFSESIQAGMSILFNRSVHLVLSATRFLSIMQVEMGPIVLDYSVMIRERENL